MNFWMTPSKNRPMILLLLRGSQRGEQEMDWNLLSCEQYDLTLHRNNVKSELLTGK